MDPTVKDYLTKKYLEAQDDSALQDARKRSGYMDIAASGAETLGQLLANANSKPIALAQGWGKSDTPTVVGTQENKVNGDVLRRAGQRGIDNAKEDRANKMQSFWDQQKLEDTATKRDTDAQKFAREKVEWGQKDEDRKDSKARQSKEDAFKDSQQARTLKMQGNEDDPASSASQTYQALAKRMLPSMDFTGRSATELKAMVPALGDIYKIDEGVKLREMTAAEAKAEKEAKAAQAKALPAEVAAKMSGFDAAGSALDQVSQAYDSDLGKFSGIAQYIPGTDADQYTDKLAPAAQTIGTALEGGKLTDVDFEKYKSMLPSAGDSKETKAKKIKTLQDMMKAKRDAEANFLKASGYNVPQAGAPTPEDDEAVAWAKANPNDPRAAAILKANGH